MNPSTQFRLGCIETCKGVTSRLLHVVFSNLSFAHGFSEFGKTGLVLLTVLLDTIHELDAMRTFESVTGVLSDRDGFLDSFSRLLQKHRFFS